MKSDITRDTFDPRKHYSRVVAQQGRVTLDADGNEQTAILLHYLRAVVQDLIGPHAAPRSNAGFRLLVDENGELQIGAGRYYVDGILVENGGDCLYTDQPDYRLPDDDLLDRALREHPSETYWLYLDAWERHITWIEGDSIREKALGGPDTCTRAKVVWQVKALPIKVKDRPRAATGEEAALSKSEWARLQRKLRQTTDAGARQDIERKLGESPSGAALVGGTADVLDLAMLDCDRPLADLESIGKARLAARVDPGHGPKNPCVTPPESKYRGAENQLYRVEIHRGGKSGVATFTWSRDNGSVVTPWLNTRGDDLDVGSARGFAAGNWIELSEDMGELQGRQGTLVRIAKVEGTTLSVDPDTISGPIAWRPDLRYPKVRRWDQTQREDIVLVEGAVPVQEASAVKAVWIDLEDGVQIQFSPGGDYRTGDYWLIPARVATGDIEWEREVESDRTSPALFLPPHGIIHHYAPLGFVTWDDDDLVVGGCRCEFDPISCSDYPYGSGSIGIGPNF